MHPDPSYSSREANELEHFDHLSQHYDANYGYDRSFTLYKLEKKTLEFIRLLNRYISVTNPFIVELGCGTGEYTKRIGGQLPDGRFLGLDISPNIIDIAKEKCNHLSNVSFKVASAYHTELPDRSVDIVCGFYALHHFDFEAINKEVFRILKPGGLLVFYEPNILNPLVYIIKSSPTLKKRVGDSPDEWAINPLTIGASFPQFELLEKYTTEFIWPLRILPEKLLRLADKATSIFRYIPGIHLLGGSIMLCFRKKDE